MRTLHFITIVLLCLLVLENDSYSDDINEHSVKKKTFDVLSVDGNYAGYMKEKDKKIVFYNKDDVTLSEADKNTWTVHNRKREFLGFLEKQGRSYKFYHKDNTYAGAINSSKKLNPKGAKLKTIPIPPTEVERVVIDPETGKQEKVTVRVENKRRSAGTTIDPGSIELFLQIFDALENIK